MRKISQLTKKIARMSYAFGSLSLTLGIILSFVHIPASASTGATGDYNQLLDNQPNACTLAFKCEPPGCDPDPSSSWSAPAGYQICMIAIKAATNYFTFESDGCVDNSPPPNGDGEPDYCAYGIGTGEGEAVRLCVENGQTDCHAISHSEYWIDVLPPTPTPTETSIPSPTPTGTSIPSPTPTETSIPSPTPTETSIPSTTPTETSIPSPTPTETGVPPSPTPTETGVPPSPTPTETGVLPSPTPTGTIIIPTETQTPTPTGTPIAVTVTPTATQTELPASTASPTATGTLIPHTATPTPTGSGEQVTPTATQATLPPPQVTGTQPAVLIPVTGVDLSSPFVQLEQIQHTLINLGLALLGIGLIFHSVGKRIDIN